MTQKKSIKMVWNGLVCVLNQVLFLFWKSCSYIWVTGTYEFKNHGLSLIHLTPTAALSRRQMIPNPWQQTPTSHISPSTMNTRRLGMSCAGSVAVPTCPVMPILPPHPTRRSQGVQSLSPPGILALSWPQSKIKNRTVVVTTCVFSDIFL